VSMKTNGLLATAGLALFATNLHAATITFSGFDDNNDAPEGYDPVATAAAADGFFDPGLPEVVIDIATVDFAAVSTAGTVEVNFDQLSFTATAPDGWFITGVAYSEEITATTTLSGFAAATASIDVNGISSPLGTLTLSGGSAGTTTFATPDIIDVGNATSVTLSIDNNLFAAGGGEISKSNAQVGFVLAPVPVPPAVWLFGSAVAGLSLVGRRRFAA